jgi:hypothetical protein
MTYRLQGRAKPQQSRDAGALDLDPIESDQGLDFSFEHDLIRKPVSTLSGSCSSKAAMTQEEERELRAQLARLQQEHRDLDAAIAALQDSPGSDIIQVQRLKKRKLQLRDRITFIEDQLTPDIIA